jgi:hypothetical protein
MTHESETAEVIYRRFVNTLRPTGTLGRSRTRRPAVGVYEAWMVLRQVIDEMEFPTAPALDVERLEAAIKVMLGAGGVAVTDQTRHDFGDFIVPLSTVSEAARYIATEYRDIRLRAALSPTTDTPK